MPVAALAWAGFALSGAASISLTNSGPQPSRVTVGWGDTLQFVNADSVPHGITSSRPELNSATTLSPGQTFTTILTGRTATYPFRQTGGRSLPGAVVSNVVGTVSLKAAPARVLYGRTATFSGVATLFGTPVSLQRRLRGERGWTEIRQLTSSADDGSYTTSLVPTIGGKYRTTIAGGQIVSLLRSVDVLPRLTITSQARRARVGRKVDIRARLVPAKAATQITLLECNVRRGAEQLVQRKPDGPGGGVKFLWTAEAGKTFLRVVVSHHDSAPGYISPESNRISVTGVGAGPAKAKHHPRIKSC